MTPTPQKMKNYASFLDWKHDQSPENQKRIEYIQALIESTAPALVTGVKWGQGCWLDQKDPKVFIHTEDDHVQVGFYNGSLLNDPQTVLEGNGKYVRFVRVYTIEEMNTDAVRDLIKQAVTTKL